MSENPTATPPAEGKVRRFRDPQNALHQYQIEVQALVVRIGRGNLDRRTADRCAKQLADLTHKHIPRAEAQIAQARQEAQGTPA